MGEPGEHAASHAIDVPSYVVGERLGSGGFGEVFRARHAVIDREVAIKVLHAKYSEDANAVARFVAEARAVNRISHRGIVEIVDFGELADGRAYCVMELISGQTLRDVLRERGRMPLAEAIPILRAIAEAIDAAHAAGIAHRDLKPDNVFVTDTGVKLIDFGLAKLTRDDPASTPVTQTGSIFGTPLYMSPEQCRGKTSDLRTDCYSFGALAYHVLVGEPPFSGDALELALHHLNDRPVAPSQRADGLGTRVDRVLLALLAKDPADRPSPLVPAVDAIAGHAALPRRARRGWWIAGTAAAAAAGIGAYALARPASSHSRDDTCAPAAERLAGIWNPQVRERIHAQFLRVARPDVAATWKLAGAELDAFAVRWSKDWDGACQSDDRTRDPLLYAQRVTCLDNALLVLRGAVEPLPTADPSNVALTFPGVIMRKGRLAECESPDVLRDQVPAPPPEARGEVSRLLIELQRLEVQRRAIGDVGRKDDVDALVARYDELVRRLEALHSASAAEVAHYRALLVRGAARAEPARQPAARAALVDAIALANRYRNDIWLARDYVMQIEEETDFGGPDDVTGSAIARVEAALARAGSPGWLAIELAVQHARSDASHGRLLDAIERLRAALATYTEEDLPPALDHNSPRLYLALALEAAGQPSEAIAVFRDELAAVERTVGPVHGRVATAREELSQLLAQSGDVTGAAAELDRALEILDQIDDHSPPLAAWRRELLVGRLDLARSQHRDDLATDSLVRLRAGNADLAEAARDARNGGRLDALAYLIEHGPIAPAVRTELAADLAFMRDPAHAPAPDRAGARAFSLGAHGDWRGAAAKLEALADRTYTWERAEAAAVRGLAALELGDPRAAIGLLGESLFVMRSCCGPFHYFEPAVEIGLARALWDTDRERARWYGDEAKRGFARLGRDAEARAAGAWLDAQR